jgi:hypothetical protein
MPKKILWPAIVTVLALLAATAVGLWVPMPGPGGKTAAPRPQATAPVAPAPLELAQETFTLAPEEVRPLTPDEARRANAEILPATLPILPARPFLAPVADVESYGRALDCLTAAVYYEAGSEIPQGQAAVAQVVVNRMRHPAYPKTICGVVFQGSERTTGCQFTFTCDGSLARTPSVLGWARARAVAGAALNGGVVTGVGMATHYHADFVVPYWAPKLVKIGQIGAHIFYRWPGGWGLPNAFTGRYALIEPIQLKMAALSSFAQPVLPEDIANRLVLPELPPLDPHPVAAPPPPRIAPRPEPLQTAVEAAPAPQPSRPAPAQASAPQVLNDPLARTPSTPARARRLPTPDN